MEGYPLVSFGTYRLGEDKIYSSLETALDCGYRSIDTADLYRNQKYIGNFLTSHAIPREEIWLTSKLNPKFITQSSTEIIGSIVKTLEELQTPYLDLYLLHAPKTTEDNLKAWSILEDFKRQGKIMNIGVSNFKPKDLQDIMDFSSTPIFTNQLEVSPFLTRTKMIEEIKGMGINISAHSSLTKGEKLSEPGLQAISQKYLKTPAQILLKWGLQKGYNVIPRSSNPIHIKDNFSLEFTIEEKDMDLLDLMNVDYYTHPQYK
jgi:2,5-diketo-D-gluconate reductase A